MSIFKDTFRPYVRDQLALREGLIAIGNESNQGIRTSRNSPGEIILHPNNEFGKERKITVPPGAYYSYTLNKQCIIRMTSMVDYVENVNLEIGGLEGRQSFNALRGAALSQNFILEGGVLSDFARVRDGKRETRRITTPRDSFPRPGQRTSLGYGDLAIGADASSDGYGIVPMPGIVDINVRTKSAYGSLREAKVNFECHNRRQLEVLEMLYMRPGYMVTLEWGWTPYINNNGEIYNGKRLLEDFFTDTGESGGKNSRIYTNNLTQQEVFNAVNKLKEYHCGNYDGFLGFVKNFGFQAREDGGFTCFTELISIGEVIESLKMPNISIIDTVVNYPVGEGEIPDESNNITIVQGGVKSDGDEAIGTGKVTRSTFNKTLEQGIFPRYDGLLGLTKALVNYATFNSFSQQNRNYAAVSEFEEQQLEQVFEFLDDEVVENATEKDASDLVSAKSKASSLAFTSGYGSNNTNLKVFLRNILEFQSANLEEFLIKKLQLSDANDLRNYIIPVGAPYEAQATEQDEGERTERNEQPYIRWDALCALINETLITKDSKALNPVMLVSDRIYDEGNKSSRLDPLLYIPVSDFKNFEANSLLDYSCDANTCILPLQFETNTLAAEGSFIDSLQIEDSLGYIPDTSVFPGAYISSIYNKDSLKYDGSQIGTSSTLKDNDKLRRIGSIFLNINMLDNIASKNADSEDYTLGKFINDIWAEVNKACPNHNFVVTDDKESNAIFIIDLPVDNNEVPLDLHEFIPFSNRNILRSFEYTSNVPKAMSATIAIQSQDPRSIQDIDGVTFAAFNRSIKNRLLSTDTKSNFAETAAAINENKNEIESKQNKLRDQIEGYRLRFFSNLKLIANEQDPISEGNIKGITKEYQKNAAYISQATVGVSTANSVIPLEFSAEIDGISGIVIGNMFKVDKSRLPKAYGRANIGFIVFNEDQKVSGQDWTTSISGKMTILPTKENKPKVNGIISTTKRPAGASTGPTTQTSTTATNSKTEALSQGQDGVTDIGEATKGSNVFLKKTKDNSLTKIGSEEITESVGFTSVRSTPEVDNEGGLKYSDNFRGLFNSWKYAGRALGVVKGQGGGTYYYDIDEELTLDGETDNSGIANIRYLSGKRRITLLSEYFPNLINNGSITDNTKVTFVPYRYYGRKNVEINGEIYHPIIYSPIEFASTMNAYNEKGELVKDIPIYPRQNANPLLTNPADGKRVRDYNTYYIKSSDTTDIEWTWYNIQFSPDVDDIFLNEASRYGNRIDLDGGNEGMPEGSKLSQFSISNDCWMRFDTLAASRDSALKAFIGNNPEHEGEE